MLNKKLIASVVLLGAFSSAYAVMPPPSGWYLEGNIGKSKITGANDVSGGTTTGNGRGWNINGGYKFMPYFAAEVGYTKYADANGKIGGVTVAKDSQYSYDLAGKALLPLGASGAELFAKLGLARLKSKVTVQNQTYVTANGITVNSGSRSATGLYFGLGADFTVWQALALNGQWQYAKGNSKTGNYHLYSLGLSYTFG